MKQIRILTDEFAPQHVIMKVVVHLMLKIRLNHLLAWEWYTFLNIILCCDKYEPLDPN